MSNQVCAPAYQSLTGYGYNPSGDYVKACDTKTKFNSVARLLLRVKTLTAIWHYTQQDFDAHTGEPLTTPEAQTYPASLNLTFNAIPSSVPQEEYALNRYDGSSLQYYASDDGRANSLLGIILYSNTTGGLGAQWRGSFTLVDGSTLPPDQYPYNQKSFTVNTAASEYQNFPEALRFKFAGGAAWPASVGPTYEYGDYDNFTIYRANHPYPDATIITHLVFQYLEVVIPDTGAYWSYGGKYNVDTGEPA